MRTILQDIDRVLSSAPYALWASSHKIDAGKVKAERSGIRRPQSSDSYGRTLIVAIRAGLIEAKIPSQPPPPPKPPDPLPRRFMAPQTYNKGSRGQDAQYCTTSLPRNDAGQPFEPSNPAITYKDGLCNGGRTGDPIPNLKPSDEMDNRSPCDGYTHNNVSFPPWPEASYAS